MPGCPLNYETRKLPLFPAIAVSILLHGAAWAFWTDNLLSHEDNTLQSIPLNSSTAINTLTVALTSLPARHSDNSQPPLPVHDKQNKAAPAVSKQPAQAKFDNPEQPRKSAVTTNLSSDIKKTKVAKPKKTKNVVQHPAIKQEALPNDNAGQRIAMHKKTTGSDIPNSLLAKSALQSQAFERPLTETKAKNNDIQATSNKPPSPVSQPATAKWATTLPAGNSVLPPLLKSKQPDYPEEARWEERIGKVTVKFKISERGRVIDPGVTKSSGHRDLDLAAIQAIQVWQFDLEEGQTYSQWYHYSFRFELN